MPVSDTKQIASVVDDVDVRMNAVPGAGRSHQGADGLGDAAATTDDPAHVIGGDVDPEANGTVALLGVDDHRLGLRGDRVDQVGHHGQRRAARNAVAGVVVVVVVVSRVDVVYIVDVIGLVDVVGRIDREVFGHLAALRASNSS
ncbi:MAG TPA: hypothetical protein VHZ02_04995, partial [Acidimicrobiales bacterium]|nr:hypothetical protein [Acidimicrobiales bacterium]